MKARLLNRLKAKILAVSALRNSGSSRTLPESGLDPSSLNILRNSRFVIGAVAALFVLASTGSVHAQGVWTTKSPLPTAQGSVSAAVADGNIYVQGGCCPGTAVNYAYDPASDTWTTKTSQPQTAFDLNEDATVNGIVYHIGGNAGGFCTDANQAYDPATDTWTLKTSMPTPRCHLAVVALNGLIYAMGGTDTSGTTQYTNLEVYDPVADSWTTKSPMPTGRSGLAGATLNGLIYAVGGSNPSVLGTNEAYDPLTNTWASKSNLPTPRAQPGAGVLNGLLYVVGGVSGGIPVTTNEAYDPSTDTWTSEASMLTARAGPAVGVVGNSLFAVAGSGIGGSVSVNEAFTAIPQTKADCMDGGWQNFGFKNQGQCIASIVSQSANH